MKTKYCIKCGRPIPADYGFCKYCGAKQPLQTTQQSTPQSAKATSQENTDYVPKSLNNPNQTLNIAKSQASFAQEKADNTAGDNDLANANRKASMAETEASQMEERVHQVASVSEAQSREASALAKATSASSVARKKQRNLTKKHITFEKQQNKSHTQDLKQQHRLNKAELHNNPKYLKKHAITQLIWAWLLPVGGFLIGVIVSSFTSAKVGDIAVFVAMLVTSIIGIVFGAIARKYHKTGSTVAFVWLVICILLGFLELG